MLWMSSQHDPDGRCAWVPPTFHGLLVGRLVWIAWVAMRSPSPDAVQEAGLTFLEVAERRHLGLLRPTG